MSSTPAGVKNAQPFEVLFRDPVYLGFKSHLYNYLRRKNEIQRFVAGDTNLTLEVGAGTSPVTPPHGAMIYSDLSEHAMKHLRSTSAGTPAVVMSATEIPFKDNAISTVVCSEVIEHIDDDRAALVEMHRILVAGGQLILTVPLHQYYFAVDDRFVDHKRRYEVLDLIDRLRQAGFKDFTTVKVAGPLEKVTMVAAVLLFQLLGAVRDPGARERSGMTHVLRWILPFYKKASWIYSWIIKIDAKVMPLSLSTIILVHCRK